MSSGANPTVQITEPSGSSPTTPTNVYAPMPTNKVIVCRVKATTSLGTGASQVVGLAYGPGQTPPASSMGEPVATFTKVAGSQTDWECQQVPFKQGGTQPVCSGASPYPLSQVKVWAMFAGFTTQFSAVEPFYGKCLTGPPPSSSTTPTSTTTPSTTTPSTTTSAKA